MWPRESGLLVIGLLWGRRLEEMRASLPGDPGVAVGGPWGLNVESRNLFVTGFSGVSSVSSESQKFFTSAKWFSKWPTGRAAAGGVHAP